MKRADLMDLPPGFRFHPTDEELITHYLMNKVSDCSFSAIAIGEVNMNWVEPWDLPWRAKLGEKEWYFFCLRDKKYPTGLRTNRATAAGYWKATGKDKEILCGKALVGMKKTLVFYKGRAPKGEKTDWVCHEYRLEGKFSHDQSSKNDWVISRVFHKTSGGKKVHISGLIRMDSTGEEIGPPTLLPSVDVKPSELVSGHVHCFSNNVEDGLITCFSNPIMTPSSSSMDGIQQFAPPQVGFGFQLPDPVTYPEPSIMRTYSLTNYGQDMNEGFIEQKGMTSVSQETVLSTENSSVVSNVEMGKKTFEEQGGMVDPQDMDCIWSY